MKSAIFVTTTLFFLGHIAAKAEPAHVQQILSEYEEAFSAWIQKISLEPDPTKKKALVEERPDVDTFARRVLDALGPSSDAESAFDALRWVYIQARDDAVRGSALTRLLKKFGDDERMAAICSAMERDQHSRARAALETLMSSGSQRTIRGHATLSLASWLIRFASPSDPTNARSLLEDVSENYQSTEYASGPPSRTAGADRWTLSDEASARLFDLMYLGIGKPAPELSGEDLDGDPVRLGEYRGKVVLVPFWAHWCTGCMLQAGFEREILARYKDRPFAILGVNVDEEDAQAIRKRNRQHGINWRNLTNDGDGLDGPLTRKWNIQTLPTTYLIDHEGMIVHKWIGKPAILPDLEAAVAKAVSRAEVTVQAQSP